MSYKVMYRAHCDSSSDTPPIIFKFLEQNKGTYPWYGSPLTLGNGSDKSVVVKNIDVDTVDNSDRDFDITYSYEPASAESDLQPQQGTDGTLTTDPLLWLDEIDISFTQTLEVVESAVFHGFSDKNGAAIRHPIMDVGNVMPPMNSAAVPYDPPIEKEVDIRVIRISKNVLQYDGLFFDQYQGAVNSDFVTIDKPGYDYRDVIRPLCGKIKAIGGAYQFVNGSQYWKQTIEIHVHPNGWRRKLLDIGNVHIYTLNGIDTSYGDFDGNPKQNADEDGYPQMSPLPLDGTGRKLGAGKLNVYGEWQVDREVNFMPLAGKAW